MEHVLGRLGCHWSATREAVKKTYLGVKISKVWRYFGMLRECFLKKLQSLKATDLKDVAITHFHPGVSRPQFSCQLWPSACFYKVLLEHSYTPLFTYHLWLFINLQCQTRGVATRDCMACKIKNIYHLPLHRKSLPTPVLAHLS